MSVEKKHFGTLASGEDVSIFILKAGEYTATLSDYGATWLSLLMPDRNGNYDDVLLGFSSLAPYTGQHPYFGATVGRFANRIANAQFVLDGRKYPLFANDGANHLHGGRRGFDKRVWGHETATAKNEPGVRFSLTSNDGEEGYPGTLVVDVTFTLSDLGEFTIAYSARCDSRTPVNLTNHAYFNLAGEGKGTILRHEVRLLSSRYLPVSDDLIPLDGVPRPVDGTPFDFRQAKAIGKDFSAGFAGYDHCFVIDSGVKPMQPFAFVREPTGGRELQVSTTLPAVQFYTGNSIGAVIGKRGSVYGRHSGFCLETEQYPDSPNRPDFPSCILSPGEAWNHETRYSFDVQL